ncbi:MAG: hypothetical protein AB8B87_06190 [Granulosicoccus sp.]
MKSSICQLATIFGVGLCLTACSGQPNAENTSNTHNDVQSASPASEPESNGALIAPIQPELQVTAASETLTFTWQSSETNQLANIYEFNTRTGAETLLSGDIESNISSASFASKTPSRAWHEQQIRLELCDSNDCVSSERVAIDTQVAATSQTLRPNVFLKGERFAESITVNHNASLIASTLPVQGAVQIHFYLDRHWVATEPIALVSTDFHQLLDVNSSRTGNTLAVLVKDIDNDDRAGSIRILERLGEAWIPINELPVPESFTLDVDSTVRLSANEDYLYLHTLDDVLIYHYDSPDGDRRQSLPSRVDETLVAIDIVDNSNQILALVRRSDSLWLVSYKPPAQEETILWQETHRHLVQGVDSSDRAYIASNVDGSSVIVAGWDAAGLETRSPVLWRFSLSGHIDTSSEPSLSVIDSRRMAPTDNNHAALRFVASKKLDTVVLGWHSRSDDDAALSTFVFSKQSLSYSVALELPHSVPTFAKQSFANDVALSGDSSTLLVSILPGSSTPSSNRAGELFVFR